MLAEVAGRDHAHDAVGPLADHGDGRPLGVGHVEKAGVTTYLGSQHPGAGLGVHVIADHGRHAWDPMAERRVRPHLTRGTRTRVRRRAGGGGGVLSRVRAVAAGEQEAHHRQDHDSSTVRQPRRRALPD